MLSSSDSVACLEMQPQFPAWHQSPRWPTQQVHKKQALTVSWVPRGGNGAQFPEIFLNPGWKRWSDRVVDVLEKRPLSQCAWVEDEADHPYRLVPPSKLGSCSLALGICWNTLSFVFHASISFACAVIFLPFFEYKLSLFQVVLKELTAIIRLIYPHSLHTPVIFLLLD